MRGWKSGKRGNCDVAKEKETKQAGTIECMHRLDRAKEARANRWDDLSRIAVAAKVACFSVCYHGFCLYQFACSYLF